MKPSHRHLPAPWLLALLALLPALLLPHALLAGAAPPVLELALVVGNNRHLGDSRWDLHFADDDALDTAQHLTTLLPRAHLWLLTVADEDTRQRRAAELKRFRPLSPTLDAWEQALDEIEAEVLAARAAGTERVRLFLHFSGHGQKGGSLHLEDSLLPPQRFRTDLARTGADEVFALMDGCHLALVIRGEEGDETLAPPPIFLEEDLALPDRPAWLGLIGSTTPVPEHDYLAGGLLSRVGVSGLLGPADLNGDERITFSEWSRYIATQVGAQAGPDLVMVPPHQDWQTTVVDLTQSAHRGIRLEASIPRGQVRILQPESRQLVAEFFHHGTRPITLRLPPGRYEVVRLAERSTWGLGAYPAERLSVVVQTGVVSISASVETESIMMIPDNLRGPADAPEGVRAVPITDWEARSLLNSPFDDAQSGRARILAPVIALHLESYLPQLGPELSQPLEADPRAPLQPGGSIGGAWMGHIASRGRAVLSLGPAFQYGIWQEPALYDGTGVTVDGRRREVRVGLRVEETYSWRQLHMGLSQEVGYAPGVITRGGALVVDASSEGGEWRYVYLRNAAASTALSVRWPLGNNWMIGPTARLDLLRLQLSPQVAITEDPVVSWQPLLSLGLDLRQSVFRQP